MDLFVTLSMIVNGLMLASLSIRASLLLHGMSSLKNILLTFGAIGGGLWATHILSSYARDTGVIESAGISCSSMILWQECGGWPIVYDSVASLIMGMAEFIGACMLVPAMCAQLFGGFYIHRRLLMGFFLDPVEILRAFLGGAILYASMVWFPDLVASMMKLMMDFANVGGRVAEGKEILTGMLKAIQAYNDLANDQHGFGNFLLVWLLKAEAYGPGLILTIVGFFSLMAQAVVLAIIPYYVFHQMISKHGDHWIVIRMAASYASFGIFQAFLWIFISFYPSSFATGDLAAISLGDAVQSLVPVVLLIVLLVVLWFALPVSSLVAAFKGLSVMRFK